MKRIYDDLLHHSKRLPDMTLRTNSHIEKDGWVGTPADEKNCAMVRVNVNVLKSLQNFQLTPSVAVASIRHPEAESLLPLHLWLIASAAKEVIDAVLSGRVNLQNPPIAAFGRYVDPGAGNLLRERFPGGHFSPASLRLLIAAELPHELARRVEGLAHFMEYFQPEIQRYNIDLAVAKSAVNALDISMQRPERLP